jgi:hypothetical protein
MVNVFSYGGGQGEEQRLGQTEQFEAHLLGFLRERQHSDALADANQCLVPSENQTRRV